MSAPTAEAEQTQILLRYLQEGREALLQKLDGLGEYDLRRPLVPTGTNLLGLVKHVAGTEAGYLGAVFGRPFPEPMPWMEEDAEPNADMWATAEESSEQIVAQYRRVWAHSDATVAALSLDAPGHVPWWTNRDVTLQRILVHITVETHRHAGHADLVRELIDGRVGLRTPGDNLPPVPAEWWPEHVARLEAVARAAEQG
ncbi:DinB family protein [Rathayibacter sp. VKM Ac-2856]|uniref:DinB family protein n=1 Tax=unclassified Rathayibacter TaxID=2609250 RepID=UPI0015671C06|nr:MULTISPECIES: DinB family protein [unclassified Rathayibacter]NQX05295.1 DinB family protein [Rathayibacter sp. VKM Ac-2858]NQX20830.1 DinB family protein [Rathayibacter sp. VKM Ac-2856]